MAAVESDMKKDCEKKSTVNHSSASTSHLIEHTVLHDTDAHDTGASAVYHSVPASKSDTKTGVHVGVARLW